MFERPVESRPPQENRPALRTAAPIAAPIEPEGSGLAAALTAIRRRRWVLLACALVFPCLAILAASLMTPRYTATATVLVEAAEGPDGSRAGLPQDEATTEALVASQAEVVRSLSVARRIVRQLDLTHSPEFAWWLGGTARPGWGAALARPLAAPLAAIAPGLASWLGVAAPAPRPPEERAELAAAEAVRDRLQASPVPRSRVLALGFTAEDPRLAMEGANLAAELYVGDQRELKFAALRQASEWLDGRANQLRQELARTEARIAELRAALGGRGAPAPTADQLGRATAELAEARAALGQVEARLAALRGGEPAAPPPPALAQQRAQRDQAQQELDRLAEALGAGHPDLRAARSRLQELDRAVGAETSRAAEALETEARALRARIRGLEDLLRPPERAGQGPAAEIRLAALEREAEASRSLLRAVTERAQKTLSEVAIERPDARLLSPAALPGAPSSPRTPLLALGAAALGIGCGLLLIWLLETTDGTLHSGEDVRAGLGLPCLALVPMLRRHLLGRQLVEDYVVRKPLSPFAESMRTLRAALWLGAEPPRVVVVTAARPAEGKTTTAVALARSAAMNGERVLLVDCDVRQPSLGRVFRCEGAPGVTDLLLGQAVLERIIRRDHLSSLDYIPAGAAEIHSLGLFMSEAMVGMLDRIRRDYDLVVLDAPPVLAMADARVVARLADATLICIRWRDTPRSVVSRSLDLLEEAHARIIGATLTQVDARAHGRSGSADAELHHPRYSGYFRE
ncbi:GumC family protein [Roseicella frigidaeris]|nr:polysaccharide biosynthesis tyrosine autokinase [Roseicella frigidaeris]